MRLRTTLFGLLVLIAIVLSGTVYAGFALHKGDIVDQERRELTASAEVIAENLDTHAAERFRLLEMAAADSDTSRHESAGQDAVLDRLIAESEFHGASVVAANGTMVAIESRNLTSEGRRDLIGSDYGHRAYVQRALDGNRYVGRPFRADSGNFVVIFSVPVKDEAGDVAGSLNAALHLERSTLFHRTAEILGSEEALDVRTDNRTLYGDGEQGANDMVATRTVDRSGWHVSVSQPRSSIDDRLLAATLVQLGAVALTILSVMLVGIWVSRTTLTHLNELIDGLTRLEDGDFDQEIDLGVTDEWAHISSQFNALAETLSQRESQLRVLNRVLRHNLRNDMSVVIARTDQILAVDRDPTEEEVRTIRQTAHNLIQTSEHARAIYEELLSSTDVDPRRVEVTSIVEQEVERLRADFPRSTIETRLPEAAWALDSDTIPIVVDELCRNALMHNDRPESERKVVLSVSTRPDSDEIRLVVRDNGPGLPDVEAELLTGQREETNIEHGSGLGLWVVNWLVDQLGGEITLASGVDRGTTVTVRLPAADPPDGD